MMNTVHEEGAAETTETDLSGLCNTLEGCLHRLKVLQRQMQEQETVEKALAAALSVAQGSGRQFGAVLLNELTKIETRAK